MTPRPSSFVARCVTAARIRVVRAFTLLELMVVVGLIALLASGIGLALGDTGGSSLATAQTTLATMLGSARAQAAVNQTDTVVAIYATRPPSGDPEKYLRLLQVFRDETPDGGQRTWRPVGQGAYLPRGVYVVPPTITGLLAAGTVWPSTPPLTSTLGTTNLRQPNGTPFGGSSTTFVIQFAADGTIQIGTQVLTQGQARLVVATAARANNIPQFNKPDAVRGVLLRPTGAVTFVNERRAF